MSTEHPQNDVVRLRAFLPVSRTGRVPVVLMLHYWGAVDLRVERGLAGELNRRGVGAVALELPFHLRRTPPGFKSGELAVRPDTAWLASTMHQAVLDVRRAVDWIESRPEFDGGRIGLCGTSLGAIVAALAFALEPRFACGSTQLGGIDLAHIVWNSSRLTQQREAWRRRGYTEERLRTELSELEPGTWLKPDGRPFFAVAARYDTVIPPVDARKLISATGAQELWLDSGHYGGALVERGVYRSVAGFFASTFAGREFAPPASLYVPTIRVGLALSPPNGLQAAVGVDVWRSNRSGDGFASALMTPKGIQGFIGHKVHRGFSVGVSVTRRTTSWGLFWNTVL